jgi:cbb3-type cytochrome oxidase subunit 3
MWLILLEALAALLILVFIVWWTMFSGRRRGERADHDEPER